MVWLTCCRDNTIQVCCSDSPGQVLCCGRPATVSCYSPSSKAPLCSAQQPDIDIHIHRYICRRVQHSCLDCFDRHCQVSRLKTEIFQFKTTDGDWNTTVGYSWSPNIRQLVTCLADNTADLINYQSILVDRQILTPLQFAALPHIH